jgi:membrane associated rhomboid family serine protease
MAVWSWVGHTAGDAQAAWILTNFGIVPGRLQPWTLVTYAFLHVGIVHLLSNLFYLWVFGSGVERAIGPWRTVAVYVAGGAFGGLLQALITATLLQPQLAAFPVVGASASCAALMGVFAVCYYRAYLSFVALPVRVHVVYVVTLFLACDIAAALWKLWSGLPTDGVAHWAHVGGFVLGLTWAQAVRLTDVAEREYLKADTSRVIDRNVPGIAVAWWEDVLKREPGSATAHSELGRAWMALGDTEQAAEQYCAAIERLISQGDNRAAAGIYSQMRAAGVRATALSAATLAAVGSALAGQESYELAVEAFRACFTRYPEAAESEDCMLRALALTDAQLKRREEAAILLRLFVQRYPDSARRGEAEALLR